MSIIENIRKRKSVRTYSGNALDSGHIEKINTFTEQLQAPFGAEVRVSLLRGAVSETPVKLGTYGVIKGASDFFALVYKEGELASESAGYLFEQLVLHCTELGLGTCWLGGTFKQKNFTEQVPLKANEKLSVVSPVGYPAEKESWLGSLMRKGAGSNKRKPFETLFFNEDQSNPLSEKEAGTYQLPLEMVRLAPSASNGQPWRVIKEGKSLHFYNHAKGKRFTDIDMGIALCHFEQSCRELKITGSLKKMDHVLTPPNGAEYVISWNEN